MMKQGGTSETHDRKQGTIDMSKELENEDRGRGSGGRRGTLALPGLGKIMGNDRDRHQGRRATMYDISVLGNAFANLRGINSTVLASADQKVRGFEM